MSILDTDAQLEDEATLVNRNHERLLPGIVHIRTVAGLALTWLGLCDPASAQAPPPTPAALLKEIHEEFLFLKGSPSQNLKADKVDPILSGKWAVMIYEGFLGMDEKQYRFAIAHFCEKQAWSLKTENSGWVGDLAGSVPVRIQAGAGAEYTIDVDPDRWLDFLGIDRTDRVQMYVAPRTSASFVHRQASFFRYSDNVLVEQVAAKAGHLWRRCPEHP